MRFLQANLIKFEKYMKNHQTIILTYMYNREALCYNHKTNKIFDLFFIKKGAKTLKLSMWTLCDHLQKDGFLVESRISEGLPCITMIHQSKNRSYSSQYAELLQTGNDVLLVSDMDTVTVKNCSIADVANSLNATLNFFSQWEHDLYDSMLKGATLQELIDIANKVFERPMFIKNDSTRTFAITRGYPMNVHPHWEKIINSMEQGIPDYDVVREVSADPEYRSVFLEKYPSLKWSPAYGNIVLHGNIFINDHRVAEVVTLENHKPFNNGDVHLMNVFIEMLEKYVDNNPNVFQSGSDVSMFLSNLLSNGHVENEQLRVISNYIGAEPSEEYVILVAANSGLSDSPMLSALREKLEVQLKDAIVIPYKSQIVILRGIKNHTYDEMITDFKAHIPKEGFRWSMSYEFSNIENAPSYYEQACSILEKAVFRREHYVSMYDMATSIISQLYKNKESIETLVHPDLIRLEKADVRENAQYCETLFYFLLCGGNYTDASKIMMLHRNTLIYRMNKIREIIHSNIDDINNRKLLFYSFLLLGKDY